MILEWTGTGLCDKMSFMESLTITINHPFEHEWDIDYDIFDEDKIDTTIPFLIKDVDGDQVLSVEFNNGLTIMKFDDDDGCKLVFSMYETDMLQEGIYTYEYNPMTFGGKEIAKISGEIIVSYKKSDTIPEKVRQVRPWDLLRSKTSPEGERVSEEKRQERLSVCEECPRFVKLTSQCLECGCIMKLKTKLAAATCPLGKW